MVLFTGDRLVAEELAQEALARALERWDRLGAMSSPEAWVYRTAFNLARSQARRRGAERRALQRMVSERSAPVLPDTSTVVAVRAAVLGLPARQRAAVVARYYGGLSVKEAAVALGCAPGTVKALVHKAVANLRGAGLVHDEEVDADAPTR